MQYNLRKFFKHKIFCCNNSKILFLGSRYNIHMWKFLTMNVSITYHKHLLEKEKNKLTILVSNHKGNKRHSPLYEDRETIVIKEIKLW